MMVFILSLAGIPPLAGFFGKFYIFTEVLRSGLPGMGLLWLVALAIALSALSLYYYLQVLKQIFVAQEPATDSGLKAAPMTQQVVLSLLALAVVVLGCLPQWLIHRLTGAMTP
jgi:NADH-quinone oxidoreductase subunit N